MGERIILEEASDFRIEANREELFRPDFQKPQLFTTRFPPEITHQIRHESCHKPTHSGKKSRNR